jgi:hypothetical protein
VIAGLEFDRLSLDEVVVDVVSHGCSFVSTGILPLMRTKISVVNDDCETFS